MASGPQIASLSLDLDNKWAYLRARGDTAWQGKPSYLTTVVPRIVEFLGERGLPCTSFVVGDDLTRDEDAAAIESLAAAGHEIANHSQTHLPWMNALQADEAEAEIAQAESLIEQVAGTLPIGFRAPGFSWSPGLLETLVRRGYTYDASVFPTFVGPLARLYASTTGNLARAQSDAKNDAPQQRFSSLGDAFRTLKPHPITTPSGTIVELPVTTMPLSRAPIHFTYIAFLAQKSQSAAIAYWKTAMRLCRLRGVGPSLLLHPLDFLGEEDEPQLADFPGMRLTREAKLTLLSGVLRSLAHGRKILAVRDHAREHLAVQDR